MARVVVGIAGGSGSGKTTVAKRLVSALGAADASLIEHDRYYRQPLEAGSDRAGLNYDHPSALETPLLVEHLHALRSGLTAPVPVYDFARHERAGHRITAAPRRAILVAGLFVLAEPLLRELLDVKVFIDADDGTRFQRRLARDVDERGRTPASVAAQYDATVRPMYHRFVEPSRQYADLIITGGGNNSAAIERLLLVIRSAMGSGHEA